MRDFAGFKKGVNLGGWFSQCDYSKERLDGFIKEDDFSVIASWGLDHVRLPIDYNILESEDGSSYLEEGFARIQRAVDLCRKNSLNIILDLHKTAGYSFDTGENQTGFFDSPDLQERFYRLWLEIAKRFGNNDDIAFELLNEVTDKAFSESWNRIATECIKRIRTVCPKTYILIGGYWNNSIDALPDLPLPQDDFVVYNFHCYEPFLFTHQAASWLEPIGMRPDFAISFPVDSKIYHENMEKMFSQYIGSMKNMDGTFDASVFETLFSKAVRLAEERNVPLYCGEYGVINKAEPEATVKWFEAIHSVFEKYGISRAAWTYRQMDFGLSDEHLHAVVGRIIPLL
ncbi:MAG: cellulase family glycosylhydrolase [Treponema sp.]|nr:cellulase family glycosylhydrolase [Treponema sp.]